MVWFLYCMASNPKQQVRNTKISFDLNWNKSTFQVIQFKELARQEVDQVFEGSNRPCNSDDAARLKYLECCIKESLRLYPPVANITRNMSEETEIGGYKIPTGASVSMQLYAVHRNEDYFPDPDAFKPERFQTDASVGRHPFAFVPFSAGPRNCIGKLYEYQYSTIWQVDLVRLKSSCSSPTGQRFAMFEEKVLASTLLRRFQFTYDSEKHGHPKANNELVLRPKHGMPLTIKHLLPWRQFISYSWVYELAKTLEVSSYQISLLTTNLPSAKILKFINISAK